MKIQKLVLACMLFAACVASKSLFAELSVDNPKTSIKNESSAKATNVRIKVKFITNDNKKIKKSIKIKNLEAGKSATVNVLKEAKIEKEDIESLSIAKIRADFESEKKFDRQYQKEEIENKIKEEKKITDGKKKLKNVIGKDEYHKLVKKLRDDLDFTQTASARYKGRHATNDYILKNNPNKNERYLYVIEPKSSTFLEGVTIIGEKVINAITGADEQEELEEYTE